MILLIIFLIFIFPITRMSSVNIFKLIIIFFFSVCATALAQEQVARSVNGQTLPVKGTLRVLIIFAEVDYDENRLLNPDVSENGSENWRKGELPSWKDELLDPTESDDPRGRLTRYFWEMSFGSYYVLGDYLNEVYTVKQSELEDMRSFSAANRKIFEKFGEGAELKTKMGFGIEDFDLWTVSGNGYQKYSPSRDDPPKIDHVMVIYRNLLSVPVDNGRAAPGSPGKIFDFNSDSYSVFGGNEHMPFNIAKHEYAHLLLGGNNFHAGGGQSGGTNYFISTQCGWSILGAANSSLLTCNAWDRDRLAWIGPEKQMSISCYNTEGREVSSDLDADSAAQQGLYLLRDFVTTGDALRIKLPFLSDKEFQQWLWVENHQTIKNNGSIFDKFQYQEAECVEDATPGLYCYMQVDKSVKEGAATYGGFGDYLRPMPSDGMYDIVFDEEKLLNDCINGHAYEVFERKSGNANPFSGNHLLEFPVMDVNIDGKIDGTEQKALVIERADGEIIKRLPYLGNAATAFAPQGKSRLGPDTNPSTASMTTLVSSSTALKLRYNKDRNTFLNNTRVKLNGISIEIIEQRDDGSILLDILFDDFKVGQNVRWCADTIELPAGRELEVSDGATLLLDRSLSPTRLSDPEVVDGRTYFSKTSTFIVSEGATLNLSAKSSLVLINGSRIIVEEGGKLVLGRRARLLADHHCDVILREGAGLLLEKSARLLLEEKTNLQYVSESAIERKRCARIKFKKK